MNNPLISIIIPVYKVEPYLRRCVDSVINQTYTNLEIILVDDGSPDDCPQICDEYAARDKRIIVIHKKNGGLSDARNAGLDICKGEYISFVDSDDWIRKDYAETLVDIARKEQADIIVGKFKKIFDEKNYIESEQIKYHYSIEVLNNRQSIEKLFGNDCIFFGIACGKLYSETLLKTIRFPTEVLHEDDYTLYKILYSSKKTIFIDCPLYFYFQRKTSIMGSAKPSSIRALRARIERYFFFKEKKEITIQAYCLKNLCWELLFAYSKKQLDKKSVGFSNHIEILNYLRICQKDHWKSKAHFIEKIVLRFFSSFPSTYTVYQYFSPLRIRKI